jgi:hypothetical protein
MSFGYYSNFRILQTTKNNNKKITEFYEYGFVNKSQRDYITQDKHYKYNSKKITEYFKLAKN